MQAGRIIGRILGSACSPGRIWKLHLTKTLTQLKPMDAGSFADIEKLVIAPIGNQEVWASGVTYYRSRNARMEESKSAGGGDFYDRVYAAERPELFMKATPNRVVGHRGKVAIRKDATWSVPEPELTLLASPAGKIVGFVYRQRHELARH